MHLQPRLGKRTFVLAQIVGALGIFALIALMPPAQGTMLLIPVTGIAQGQMTAVALAHGASLVARGPLPTSVFIYGNRAALVAPMARVGVLIVAGGTMRCTGKTQAARA